MGSFNTTCAVSNTPIIEGDDVRLFLLASSKLYTDTDVKKTGLAHGCQCYPWDDFQVIGGFPLKAKYADYDNYTVDEESIEARFIMMKLRQNYVMQTREEGKKYRGWEEDFLDIPASDLTWDLVFEMHHRECFWLQGYGNYNTPYLGIMAIHESVYQLMLDEDHEVYIGYPEGVSYDSDFHPYENRNFQIALQKELERDLNVEKALIAKEYYSSYQEELKSGKITEEQMYARCNRIAEMRLSDNDSHRMHYAFATRSIYQEIVEAVNGFNKNNPERAVELDLNAIRVLDFEAKYFNERMQARNIMYRPIMISGQVHDRVADGVFLQKVAAAVGALGYEWEEDEHVVTQKFTTSWQEVTVPQIIESISDWYEGDELEEHLSYINNLIGDKDVVVFTKEDLEKEENKFLRSLIWNKTLDLHLKAK
ncbi:hypothetical protein XbC2_374 [Xanthomonas phage XbC2]|nr:hypothetical protein XbC2_374 [Xanthomonas phage XbC2]